jgi:branched-chain amino acid transport system substrate-binding protein
MNVAPRLGRRRLAALGLALASGAAASAAADPLQLAQVVELTGAASTVGDAWRNGVEMAAQEINAGGGLLGRLLQVTTYDAQSTAAGGHAAMTKALEIDPLAVLGPALSEAARGALAVPHSNRAVIVGGGAPELTAAPRACAFRAVPSDAVMMARLCRWLRDDAHARRIAVLSAETEPFHGRRDMLAREARSATLEIIADAVTGGDLMADVARVLHAVPDALVLLLPTETAGRAAAEARRLAPHLPLFGEAPLIEARALAAAGAAAEGLNAHVLLADDPAAPELSAFQERFLARFKELPNEYAAAGYAAFGAVRAAVERTGAADPRALCDALHGLALTARQQPMLLVDSAWNASGNLARASWMVEIRQGRAAMLRALREPATD